MMPDRWKKLDALFHEALALQGEARAAYLVKACDGDEELRAEAERLLAAHERDGTFLDAPIFVETADLAEEDHSGVPVGGRIGPYRIISRIGRGGMGEVFLTEDSRLGRKVALKVLPAAFTQDPDRVRRFEREAKAASALNHPNILTIHEIGKASTEEGGAHYIVSEFVEGETLRARIERGTLSLEEVSAIADQIAGALGVSHQAGIIHRDIKPENVMLRPDGLVKVLDFGLAKLTEERQGDKETEGQGENSLVPLSPPLPVSTTPGMVMGTVNYMSPEQVRGLRVDHRTDLFSLGVMMYEMIAGRRPFEGATASDVIAAILQSEPPPIGRLRPGLPPELEQMVARMLAKDREARPGSAAALRAALQRLQRKLTEEEESFAAEKTTFALSAARENLRWRRWGIAAGGAAALLLVAIVIVWRLWESEFFWRNPLAGARVERLTDFEGDEVDAAVSPDGTFIAFLSDRDGRFDAWVSQIGSGEFVNLGNGRFPTTTPIRLLLNRVGFSGDGTQVWIQEGQGLGPWAVWLAAPIGGAPHPFLAGGMEPAWSPDRSRIVYHTFAPGDPIFIADRSGSNPKQIFVEGQGGHCHYLRWSPDGRFIYFVRGIASTEEMDIWRIPVTATGATDEAERITRHNARVAYPAWLDSRTLIYSATAEDGSGHWLYALDVERRIPRRVSSGVTEQYLSVAVASTRPRRLIATVAIPSAGLWTVPVSDRVQTEAAASRFAVSTTRALGPRFASDSLFFLSSRGGGDGLWKREKGAARELWKGNEGGVVAPPAISPDGSRVCFSVRKQGRAGLYVMNADGANVRVLSETLDVRGAAAWSPDGKWIVIAASEREGTRVFKVPVDGGAPVRLVDTFSYNPIWSPDGRFIIYSQPLHGGTSVIKAVTPDKAPFPMPDIQVLYTAAAPYRFAPNQNALIVLQGFEPQNFYQVDLETGAQRQLTDLKPGFLIHSFDVSPDGRQLIFDRLRYNSDIVMMDLAR
jgi:serine/threonine protein kinase/Tol biopolymer transport system component